MFKPIIIEIVNNIYFCRNDTQSCRQLISSELHLIDEARAQQIMRWRKWKKLKKMK